MTKNLVIVESPAKAKTIQSYLGHDYKVASSFGHIRDLPSKTMAVDIEHNFKPDYVVSADKKKTVKALKSLLDNDTVVWLATDEDREGEAIAWHLSEVLKLNDKQTRRIVFHEITKTAIDKAIANPRQVNKNLVDAQQARRVLDRLVGYELSPVLWRKVRPGLSAGRVQSVAVKLVVDREREILAHKPTKSFKLSVIFKTDKGEDVPTNLIKPLKEASQARDILESLIRAKGVVNSVDQTDGQRNPSPPFTTSTLQQEASRRLGYSVRQTMSLAQKLYESGAITYMRTDSLAIASSAQKSALGYIQNTYGSSFIKARQYKTKSIGAQEAHEAIRPTEVTKESTQNPKLEKLYSLIRNRFLASQMAPALLARTNVKITCAQHQFEAKGEVIKFMGWLKAYPHASSKENELPQLQQGQSLKLESAQAVEALSRPPARYGEAGLVRKLEEMGIGRPSTYAPTISTIQDRGYITKNTAPTSESTIKVLTLEENEVKESIENKFLGGEKGKLLPTDTALVVTDFLSKYFSRVIDYDFTAEVEEEFDSIASGKHKWNQMIKNFYSNFKKTVETAGKVTRQEATQARALGLDPKSKKPIIARFGRFGPMLQRGSAEDEDKPDFAQLPAGTTLDTVSLKQALVMFSLPRELGQHDGQVVKANIGRFGPYVQIGTMFASIPKDEDVFSIKLDRAMILIKEQQMKSQQNTIKKLGSDEKIEVKKGRFGPYVTDGTTNVKIPKNLDPDKITLEQALELFKKKA
jgi:DNA topoisomerase-1